MPFFPDIFVSPSNSGYNFGGYGQGGYGSGVTTQAFIDYYLSLFTSQYQNSKNLKAWFQALAQPFADVGLLLAQWVSYFDLNLAAGNQLDVIGQIVGANRTVNFTPTGGVSPVLTDDTYRILLQAKIALNQWNGKIGSMYGIWQQLFPGGTILIIDNQDMTATVTLAGAFSSILQDLIQHDMIVPRPEGVEYTIIFPTLPMFGLDSNGSFVAGLDKGHLV